MKYSKASLFPFILVCLLFSGCSTNKNSQEPIKESAPEADFIVEDDTVNTEGDVISLDEDLYEEIESDLDQESNLAADNIYDDVEKVEAFNSSVKEDVYKVLSDNFKTYTVEENETLMWIAFKLYGDYKEWQKLKEWNENLLDYNHSIAVGTELKYKPLPTKFNWRSPGNPYLILKGDTLGIISSKVYEGDSKYWRALWKNNQMQIKDPNLIFAGFTLFYLPLEEVQRDLASEER